jgi:hypothetical protein
MGTDSQCRERSTCLRSHGHAVLNPALPDDDFDAAVRVAQTEYDRHRPDVVVGTDHRLADPESLKAMLETDD